MNKIESILVKSTLRAFYDSYQKIGEGIITNHKGGAKIYDLMTNNGENKIDLPTEKKKEIKENCIKLYPLFYSQYSKYSNEEKKKLFDTFLKSELVAAKLNSMLKEDGSGQIVDIDETIFDFNGLNYK